MMTSTRVSYYRFFKLLLEMDSVLDNGSMLHGESVLNEMSSLEMLREQANNRTFVEKSGGGDN
jgi:hypothetical protein